MSSSDAHSAPKSTKMHAATFLFSYQGISKLSHIPHDLQILAWKLLWLFKKPAKITAYSVKVRACCLISAWCWVGLWQVCLWLISWLLLLLSFIHYISSVLGFNSSFLPGYYCLAWGYMLHCGCLYWNVSAAEVVLHHIFLFLMLFLDDFMLQCMLLCKPK